MAGAKTDELTTEEAKAQLRYATEQLGVRAWVRQHPYEALTLGVATGMVLAASRPMRHTLLRLLIRTL